MTTSGGTGTTTITVNLQNQISGESVTANTLRFRVDLDGDGQCDVMDLLTVVYAFGETADSPGYHERIDVDDDGEIGVVELLRVVYDFGTGSG